jgi:hypothetical protein
MESWPGAASTHCVPGTGNEDCRSYPDQWAFLSRIQKISGYHFKNLIPTISPGNELVALKIDEEENPWETHRPQIILEKKEMDKPGIASEVIKKTFEGKSIDVDRLLIG